MEFFLTIGVRFCTWLKLCYLQSVFKQRRVIIVVSKVLVLGEVNGLLLMMNNGAVVLYQPFLHCCFSLCLPQMNVCFINHYGRSFFST